MASHYMADTIVAISTPPGQGGIGIIRVSGSLVTKITPKLLGSMPIPRKATYSSFLNTDGTILEKVIALFFPKPHSSTGEDILEIHGHGGEIILDLLLEQILKTSDSIRLANPGEFTERAFLNGKIDLIQAEAVADIIHATSYQAAKSASNSLQGIFSKKIHIIIEKITELRVHIESSLDFSEDITNTISYSDIKNHLQNIIYNMTQIYKSAQHGVLLRDGINITIAGKPNAGKSSLFNKLINMDRAIISAISGTTRDTLHESIYLNGITLHITDTAGLKNNSENEIEEIGIQRTYAQLNNTDHVLWVVDSNNHANEYTSIFNSIEKICSKKNKKIPITIIRNKSDLSLEKNGISTIKQYTCITLSALQNNGIDLLRNHLKKSIRSTTQKNKKNYLQYDTIVENQGNFIARRRHLNALERSSQYLLSAKNKLIANNNNVPLINDLLAEDLKLAQNELNKIIGKHQFISDDLLEKIFSQFCIGK